MQRLSGKVAVVAGASKGIGKAVALAFAREGADVVVTARDTAALTTLVEQIRELGEEGLAVTAEVSRLTDIDRIATESLARFGHVDILVNSAGVIHQPIDLIDFDVDLWRQVIDVNLTGSAFLMRALLPSMIERGSGRIINLSSV